MCHLYTISDNYVLCKVISFWYLISCYRRGCLLLYYSSQLPLLLFCILSRAFSFHCLGLKGFSDFGLICFCFPLAAPFFFILFTLTTRLWSCHCFLIFPLWTRWSFFLYFHLWGRSRLLQPNLYLKKLPIMMRFLCSRAYSSMIVWRYFYDFVLAV